MKKIIKNIIEVLGEALVLAGEVGLMLIGLSFIWKIGKLEFFIALGVACVVAIIRKIKNIKNTKG